MENDFFLQVGFTSIWMPIYVYMCVRIKFGFLQMWKTSLHYVYSLVD
jgi:hypothetical protein